MEGHGQYEDQTFCNFDRVVFVAIRGMYVSNWNFRWSFFGTAAAAVVEYLGAYVLVEVFLRNLLTEEECV